MNQSSSNSQILSDLRKFFNILIGVEKDMTIQLPSYISDVEFSEKPKSDNLSIKLEPDEMC
jgi:hypothetical protein